MISSRIASSTLLLLLLVTQTAAAERWIDLTHTLSDKAVFWPTADPYQRETVFEGMTEGGYFYSAYVFKTAEHGGTHIDAPVHFAKGKRTVDEIPLSQLIGDAVVVDVSEAVASDRDYRVSVADLQRWESSHGTIPRGSIVLLRTGFGQFWPDPERYLGTALRGEAGAAALSFPGLGTAAADWLISERGLAAVGIDTASIDYGKSRDFSTHVRLMKDDIPAFENVAGLEQLPATGAFVVALPAKLAGGSGAPLRIVARIAGD
ncbi:cyclase family protein [Parahaliea maris]|uniref:Cyclase family protein n=1 Tax=Parahaliea maris TaxID=2716870 RepID=A0A5C9A6G1_9GAMM|nr:cyclase family protein [Parahaliea maris]TXS96533.1 cyclase family protein [Parahaliea maris]